MSMTTANPGNPPKRRRKRARKNAKKNRPGLWAFVGCAAGAIPGVIVRAIGRPAQRRGEDTVLPTVGGVMIMTGWIVGGGVGGHFGATRDRHKRAMIGGAIGGIVGPLGAALGGYIGGRKPDAKKRNPSGATTAAIALGAGTLAAAAGYGANRLRQRRKEKKEAEAIEPKAPSLQDVLGTSTLEEAEFMVGDIAQPILLRTAPDPLPVGGDFQAVPHLRIKIDRPAGETTIEEPAGAAFGQRAPNEVMLFTDQGDYSAYTTPGKAIGSLITGLSPYSAQLAYELALIQIADNGVNWADPDQRDGAIVEILSSMARGVDWSQGLSPYTYGSAPWEAWTGVQIVGTIANQSYFNKIAMGG